MKYHPQSMSIRYDHHHDLPIYQAEVITGRRRRSIDNNDVVFATSYSYNNDDRPGSLSLSSSGRLDNNDGNERRASNSLVLRLTRVIILFTLLFTIIIRYLGGVDTSSSPLELMTKMILMPHQKLSSIISSSKSNEEEDEAEEEEVARPSFVFEHPYVTSSYYTSTKSIQTLLATQNQQVVRNLRREAERAAGIEDTSNGEEIKTRLAIVRPFCEFDAEALPTTFTCWNALPPCKAAAGDIGDDMDEEDMYEEDTVGYRRYLNEQNSDLAVILNESKPSKKAKRSSISPRVNYNSPRAKQEEGVYSSASNTREI